VPPKKVPYFKPGKELKDLLNRDADGADGASGNGAAGDGAAGDRRGEPDPGGQPPPDAAS
jgi:hypothetical protein